MVKKLIGMTATVAVSVLAGCSVVESQVPKCSDQDTLDLVRQIIAQSSGLTNGRSIPTKTLRSALEIEYPHAISLEENIKKYTCEAGLRVKGSDGSQGKTNIQYSSQLDDDDQHLVQVQGFTGIDQVMLSAAIGAILHVQKQPAAAAESSPVVAPAQITNEGVATEMPSSEDFETQAEHSPEQVAENNAIREEIFSGAGKNGTPRFSDYPAVELYTGPAAALDKSSEEARSFQTRLSNALAENPVDFAGEYVTAGWGCGTSCSYVTFVNKRTGQVIKEGLGGEMGPNIVNYLPSSEMVIAEGAEVDDDFNSTGNYAFFYRLSNGELQFITKVPVPEEIY